MATFKFEQMPQVMKILGKVIPKNMQKLMGVAARTFGRSVVLSTPVDVGDARASWVASLGAPSNFVRGASSPNQQLGSATATLAAGRFADIPNAVTAITQHNTELVKYENSPTPGISFFFANNQSYIVPLEQGTLRGGQTLQNTAGWVERSIILAAETAIREKVIPKSAGGGKQFTSFKVKGV